MFSPCLNLGIANFHNGRLEMLQVSPQHILPDVEEFEVHQLQCKTKDVQAKASTHQSNGQGVALKDNNHSDKHDCVFQQDDEFKKQLLAKIQSFDLFSRLLLRILVDLVVEVNIGNAIDQVVKEGGFVQFLSDEFVKGSLNHCHKNHMTKNEHHQRPKSARSKGVGKKGEANNAAQNLKKNTFSLFIIIITQHQKIKQKNNRSFDKLVF